ncbi:MAG: hypothetical protein ACO3UM_10850, partial [Planctomycetota bacterium]
PPAPPAPEVFRVRVDEARNRALLDIPSAGMGRDVRVQVTLATGIPEAMCRQIGLGYRDPDSIDPAEFQEREDDGVLYVPKAGELLFRLASERDPGFVRRSM